LRAAKNEEERARLRREEEERQRRLAEALAARIGGNGYTNPCTWLNKKNGYKCAWKTDVPDNLCYLNKRADTNSECTEAYAKKECLTNGEWRR